MSAVTEKELIERSTAPRVTLEGLKANIRSVNYIYPFEAVERAPDEQLADSSLKELTICIITLNNGFTVQGKSACADPRNYKKDIGDRIAYEDAEKKIWELMGYALKQELYLNGETTFAERLVREERELNDKQAKLSAFITGQTFGTLSVEEQSDLTTQRSLMWEYQKVLRRRISRLVSE